MRLLSRRFAITIVMLSALFLLGVQQAAFVHLLGHLGPRAESDTKPQGSHGKVPDLPCSTCAAFATLDAAPLPLGLPLAAMPLSHEAPQHAIITLAPRLSVPYLARAPPILL